VIAMTGAQPAHFGALLKRLRRVQGLSQAQLAERAGYSTVYVSMLERGARRPLASTVALLDVGLRLVHGELLVPDYPLHNSREPTSHLGIIA
jgi:transcriptional regulator with XRE-family HTH domain